MYATVTVTIADYTYTASTRPVPSGDGETIEVRIYRDDVWSGTGEWDDAIVDCPADLGDDVYDAIEAALRTVLA
jgi:hypothetical protein